MPIRLSGLASGLDTEAIVGALVSAYSYKKDKYVKAQTKLSWKQEAWSTLNSKVYSLYTSVGTMRYSSNYTAKKTTVSDTSKATATASGSAINGTQTLSISKLAKTAYVTGGELSSSITGKSTLADLGFKTGSATGKGSIQVRTNTGTTNIEIESTTTINDFVSKLNEAGVQASFDENNHRFFVSSKTSGKAGDFSISANNELGLTGLIKMGLLTDTEIKSITSEVSGSELVSRKFSYTVDGTSKSLYGSIAGFESKITNIVNAKKILASSDSAQVEKDWANSILNDEDYQSLAAYVKDAYAGLEYSVTTTNADGTTTTTTNHVGTATTTDDGTTYAIDWTSLSSAEISAIANKMYSDADKTYDSDAQTATSQEITTAVNAIRDAYVNLEKVKSETYETDAEKAAAIEEAQSQVNSVLKDPVNAKWAAYIEENFGSVNSATDSSYSNFWTQSDNLELAQSVFYRVDLSAQISLNGKTFEAESEATKIDGQDASIKLNGVTYTSSTNNITVNGLTIEALAETTSDITVNVSNDTDALYDKVKDFLTSYNNLMNEMQKLYNADSAKDYEPLTDDEKAEMSETEIEKWEQKIKDSLLRRDTSLSGIISAMTMSMMKVYDVNGEKLSWSTFGIHTLGTLNAEKNEGYAYHIDGDSEDSKTSGNEEKLRAALASDPDRVIEFLKQATSGLYSALDEKMKSTAVKSVYTVYNDKEMASEYSNYSSLIKTWTDRVTDMEDAYYKKFAAMESALATLQSNSSSISSLLGG